MIKLASDKSFNRGICPMMNIKGKKMQYPFKLQYNNFHLQAGECTMGPKQMMIMDIIGTKLIHTIHKNNDFSGRIPKNTEKYVRQISGQYMSAKLLKYVMANRSQTGLIPESFSEYERLSSIDKLHGRIKKPVTIVLNDGQLRRELPFLRKYSSKQIMEMIVQTYNCVLWMNYPVCYFTGKRYEVFPYNNFGFNSRLFTLKSITNSKMSKENEKFPKARVLERKYEICFDTILGYAFMQNMFSSYMDLLPGKFYEMSDYAQLYYRIFILSYFPNKKSGKTPKNPLSLNEIKQRLVLKTKDEWTVRKVIRRILEELKANRFIKDYAEEKLDYKYVYRYIRNSWKEITGEEIPSETDLNIPGTDLADIGNSLGVSTNISESHLKIAS